jgi:hypothetical protein
MAKRKMQDEEVDETTVQNGESGPAAADESDVKRPELKGKNKSKPTYEQPGSDNMSREDIGAKEENQ